MKGKRSQEGRAAAARVGRGCPLLRCYCPLGTTWGLLVSFLQCGHGQGTVENAVWLVEDDQGAGGRNDEGVVEGEEVTGDDGAIVGGIGAADAVDLPAARALFHLRGRQTGKALAGRYHPDNCSKRGPALTHGTGRGRRRFISMTSMAPAIRPPPR